MRNKFLVLVLIVVLLFSTIVVPVNAAVGDEIICTATIPSTDGTYTYSSSHSFNISQTQSLYSAGYYWGSAANGWMQISVNVPSTSYYKIYLYSPLAHSGNDDNATIEVTDSAGNTTSILINQQTTQGWVDLGNYSLVSGTTATVKLSHEAGGKVLRFDSIKLVELGNTPIASNAKINGKGALNEALTVEYDYQEPNDSPEGNTTFEWLISDTAGGAYTPISGATGNSYVPTTADSNKFIKCKITPASATTVGDPVETTPVQIKWKLDFEENFDQPNPDGYEDEWTAENAVNTHILCGRYPENVVVSDGKLNLITKKETKNGQDWTSGSVGSNKDFRYGYYEVSYKYAPGVGLNQSFWFMTRTGNSVAGEYELDVNEGSYPNKVASNYHYYVDGVHMSDSQTVTFDGIDFSEDYHTFACEWTENQVIMYMDGQEYRWMENTTWASQQDAVLYLSNAVVGWYGEVTDDLDGTALKFDYVKRYIPISDTKASLPYASNVNIPTEEIALGDTLQASYTYNSMENLAEAGSEYKWLRTDSLTEKDWEVVGTGTTSATNAPTYTIGEDDLAHYLVCAIKVKNANREGQYIYSNVIEVNTPYRAPEAQQAYLYRDGDEICGYYDYYDLNSDTESGSTYAMMYADTADAESWTTFSSGAAIGGQEVRVEIPQEANGKYIKMTVVPRNNGEAPNVGAEVTTNVVGPINEITSQTIIQRTSTIAADGYSFTSNVNPGFSQTGAYYGGNGYYYIGSLGSYATHNITLPTSSLYRVYIYNPLMHSTNDNRIVVEVKYAGGKVYTTSYNGKTHPAGWMYLGDFPFAKEQPAEVTFRVGNGGNVRIDTVKMIDIGASTVAATDLSISGQMMVNSQITADYTFTGGTEGNSSVVWYESDSANGPWTKLGTGSSYLLTENQSGKYIKYTVMPAASTGNEGRAVSYVSTATVGTNIHYYTSTIAADGYSVTSGGTLSRSYTGSYTSQGYYYFGQTTGTASHNVAINQTGLYRVSLYNPLLNSTNDPNTIIEVTYANGATETISYNAQTTPAGWIELGNYQFIKDQTAVVTLKSGSAGNVRIDTIRLEYLGENTTVSATDLTISGTLMAGATLTANYTFNGGTEANSVVNWYSSSTATGDWKYLGTGTSYTLTNSDANKYIKYTIIPVAADFKQGPHTSWISSSTVLPSIIYYSVKSPSETNVVTFNRTFGTSNTGAYNAAIGYYYSGAVGDWMKQQITLPAAGTYKVYYYQPLAHSGNTSNALINVTHANGSTENSYNFKTTSGWIELGTFEFGTTAEILTTVGSGGHIRVDTVRFERVS